MMRLMRGLAIIALVATASSVVRAQSGLQSLDGMWSDPPLDPISEICAAACTQAAIDRLNALLDDPANDDRSVAELIAEARRAEVEYLQSRFSPEALEDRLPSPLLDPGYLNCEPWGLARQIFARHQLEIRSYPDRVEMRYGEWDAHRTVHLDGRAISADAPRSLLGYSVGHYEGDTLVVESSGISANFHRSGIPHSEDLRIVERYSRDGERLLMTAVFSDPWGLVEPLEGKKIWGFRPDLEIAPYADCEIPTEVSE